MSELAKDSRFSVPGKQGQETATDGQVTELITRPRAAIIGTIANYRKNCQAAMRDFLAANGRQIAAFALAGVAVAGVSACGSHANAAAPKLSISASASPTPNHPRSPATTTEAMQPSLPACDSTEAGIAPSTDPNIRTISDTEATLVAATLLNASPNGLELCNPPVLSESTNPAVVVVTAAQIADTETGSTVYEMVTTDQYTQGANGAESFELNGFTAGVPSGVEFHVGGIKWVGATIDHLPAQNEVAALVSDRDATADGKYYETTIYVSGPNNGESGFAPVPSNTDQLYTEARNFLTAQLKTTPQG